MRIFPMKFAATWIFSFWLLILNASAEADFGSLGVNDKERVEWAIEFMRSNEQKPAASKLQKLLDAGKIRRKKFSDAATGAETDGDIITINTSRLSYISADRSSIAW